MKKIFCIITSLLLVLCLSFPTMTVFARDGAMPDCYYIDSEGGSDSADGLSEATAWKTAAHSFELEPGSKLLFKRGGVYTVTTTIDNAQGTAEAPIVISDYGDEAAPRALLTTDEAKTILTLNDCSYVTVSNLEMTAHIGSGIWVNTVSKPTDGILLKDLVIHDIQNHTVSGRDVMTDPVTSRHAIFIRENNDQAINSITVSGCELYDCGNGIYIGGINHSDPNLTKDYDAVYARGVLVEGCSIHDMDAEGIVLGVCYGALVKNCTVINCCQGGGKLTSEGKIPYFTAAMWVYTSKYCTFTNCECAGQLNVGDGMTVDFDGGSDHCTYQYIYSHDNTRFMCCNAFKGGRQVGNTVRYCLSLNDSRGRSRVASYYGEDGFSFYNNVMINCNSFQYKNLYNSTVANNILELSGEGYFVEDGYTITGNNKFSSNCYRNAANPICDPFATNVNPGFVGTDSSDPNSYKLVKGSPLIGAGTKIDDGLEYDFYGNKIVSTNIGCYGGSGEEGTYADDSFIVKLITFFKASWLRIIALLAQI